jgi:hypothetical protein
MFLITLIAKVIINGFAYKCQLLLFLSSYNLPLLYACRNSNYLFFNVFLSIIYFNCRNLIKLPENKLGVKFALAIFIVACGTGPVQRSRFLALINLTIATILIRGKRTFLNKINLLVKTGLLSIMKILTKTPLLNLPKSCLKYLEQKPKLAKVLFFVSGGG